MRRWRTRAKVRVVVGGPDDVCGGGYFSVEAKSHLTNANIYGERFAQGDADIDLRWYDRQQGIAGADLDVRSFVLDKIRPPRGTRAGATGTVVGSASLRRGGALAANVMIGGVPLSRVDTLGSFAKEVEGSVSGVAHVTGNLDGFGADPGFVAHMDLDVAGMRVRGLPFPGSHLDARLTQRLQREGKSRGRTRCGAPIAAPFDKAAYLADTSSHGDWTVNGDLLGGALVLRDVVATRAKSPVLSGRVSLHGVDLGSIAKVIAERQGVLNEAIAASPTSEVGGELSGDLIVEEIHLDQPAKSRAKFFSSVRRFCRAAGKSWSCIPRASL